MKGVLSMLCQFTFKNFKSYRDETIFDMQAANIEEFSDSLICPTNPKFSKLLPLSVIYGPNAGGKSGVLEALSCLLSLIRLPLIASGRAFGPFVSDAIALTPFLFDDTSPTAPTEFELYFRTAVAEYRYLLHLTKDHIVSESLYRVNLANTRIRHVMLFEREGDEIELGSLLARANSRQISSSIPYLSFLAINYKFPDIQDAFTWIDDAILVDCSSGKYDDFVYLPKEDHGYMKDMFLFLIKEMDIPISDYEFLTQQGPSSLLDGIRTIHKVGEEQYALPLAAESRGTIKLFSVITPILLSLMGGGLLIVDELDAKLHPKLLRHIIKLYLDPTLNPNGAQLLFTSHDLSTMRNDLLRRDEIWFAARNEESVSELWSLYDLRDERGERIKSTAAYDKQYLEGRYGADPYLRQMLDWSVLNAKEAETT